MKKQLIAVAAALALWAPGILAAQAQPASPDTYQWHGELVSLDSAANTLTVKSRLVSADAAAEVSRMKAGERVLIAWSGYDKYADAIRSVTPFTEGRAAKERFLMPAELVSNETPNQYVTFRVRIPATAAAALKPVKPGEWVTVTASHKAPRETETVVSAKPYVTSAATPTS